MILLARLSAGTGASVPCGVGADIFRLLDPLQLKP